MILVFTLKMPFITIPLSVEILLPFAIYGKKRFEANVFKTLVAAVLLIYNVLNGSSAQGVVQHGYTVLQTEAVHPCASVTVTQY